MEESLKYLKTSQESTADAVRTQSEQLEKLKVIS